MTLVRQLMGGGKQETSWRNNEGSGKWIARAKRDAEHLTTNHTTVTTFIDEPRREWANIAGEFEHVGSYKRTSGNKQGRFSPPASPLHQRLLAFIPRSIFSISFVEICLFSRKFVGVATSLLHVATLIFFSWLHERSGYANTYRRAALWPVPFNELSPSYLYSIGVGCGI
jgi:hypothetical protein